MTEQGPSVADARFNYLLDASAVLTWLQQEPGAEQVDHVIERSAIGAANWSEVLQKTWQHGRNADEVAALLLGLGLEVQPVTAEIAAEAARIWSLCSDLSLGDRLCLAAGRLHGSTVWTAHRNWAGRSLGILLKVVR